MKIVVVFMSAWILVAAQNGPVVETTFGPIQGAIFSVPDQEQGGFYFRGVPFAAPPVGDLRFEPPQDPEPWTDILETIDYGPACPQQLSRGMEIFYNINMSYIEDRLMDEDCLCLNVYTPAMEGIRPVMVFIHGGAFTAGSAGGYDNRYLASGKDIVSVHIQYRLGPLGWLVTRDGSIGGNMAFMDQVKALHWVRANIAKFGGNPDDVTIYGESAGAQSASLHLVSPRSAGLFSKAIFHSGSAIGTNLFSPPWDLPALTQILAGLLGCPIINSANMVACLRALDADMFWKPIIPGLPVPYVPAPIVDGDYFPDLPQNLVEDGLFNKEVDVMLGNLEIEGYMLAMAVYPDFILPDFDREKFKSRLAMLLVPFYYPQHTLKWEEIAEAAMEEYAADLEGDDLTLAAAEMAGDIIIVVTSFFTAELLANHSEGNLYFYEFLQRPSVSIRPDYITTDHVDDLAYMGCTKSGTFMRSPVDFTDDDKLMDDIMLDYWANFARNGDPNGEGLFSWPSYRDNGSYILLQVDPDVTNNYKPERMKFWLETVPDIINGEK